MELEDKNALIGINITAAREGKLPLSAVYVLQSILHVEIERLEALAKTNALAHNIMCDRLVSMERERDDYLERLRQESDKPEVVGDEPIRMGTGLLTGDDAYGEDDASQGETREAEAEKERRGG